MPARVIDPDAMYRCREALGEPFSVRQLAKFIGSGYSTAANNVTAAHRAGAIHVAYWKASGARPHYEIGPGVDARRPVRPSETVESIERILKRKLAAAERTLKRKTAALKEQFDRERARLYNEANEAKQRVKRRESLPTPLSAAEQLARML